MSKPTVHGFGRSTYVWTARAALALAGIEHDFVAMLPPEHRSPEHLARHPFGKVPTLTDPDLFEAAAIVRWAHEVGEASFWPDEPLAAARVDGLVSCACAYLYDPIVLGWLFGHVWSKGERDEAAYAAAEQAVRDALAGFEAQAGDGPWLVGSELSAADLFVGPLLFVLLINDEGKAVLAGFPRLQALVAAIEQNEAFMGVSYLRG